MPKTIGPKFPIVITSYEIVMNDVRHLKHYNWKYIVVDEVLFLLYLSCLLSFLPHKHTKIVSVFD